MKIARINNRLCFAFTTADEKQIAEGNGDRLFNEIKKIISDDVNGGCGVDNQTDKKIEWDIVIPD